MLPRLSHFFPKDPLVHSIHKMSLLRGLIKAEEQRSLLSLNSHLLCHDSFFCSVSDSSFSCPTLLFLFLRTAGYRTFFHPNYQPIILCSFRHLIETSSRMPQRSEFIKKKGFKKEENMNLVACLFFWLSSQY